MTVRENLDMGAYLRRDKGLSEDMDRIFELFPRLKEREKQKAGTMSGGEQQMLAIGRALMARPRLLLLDEPSMGIAPILVERIYETIEEINRTGTTILLVEQSANFALGVSTRGYVLATGAVALNDSAREPAQGPRGPEGLPRRMTATIVLLAANLGVKSLYLLIGWLGTTIICQELTERKGYGARWGLASGMLLTIVGVIIWLVMPAKEGSAWKVDGPFGRRSRPS